MFRTSTFIPTLKVNVEKQDGYSETGKPVFARAGRVGISPVRLESEYIETSIRTDKSGTKGRAEETVMKGRVLVEKTADIAKGDLLVIYADRWKIESIYPRHDMDGSINHFQVDLSAWA